MSDVSIKTLKNQLSNMLFERDKCDKSNIGAHTMIKRSSVTSCDGVLMHGGAYIRTMIKTHMC